MVLWICSLFLFKLTTTYELRISDGSSGVCSSDLSARLQVGRAGRRLGRHQGAADDVEDEALGIGELLPGSVDAVVVRIARGDEAGGRLRRGVAPGLHRRQVGIDRVVGVADAVVELRPATRAGGRDGCLDLGLVAVLGMELLQI